MKAASKEPLLFFIVLFLSCCSNTKPNTMKTKIILLTCTMFLSIFNSRAQVVNFGIKAGLNLANITSNYPGYSSDTRVGFHAGGGVNIGVTGNFSVDIDLLYSQKGAKQHVEEFQTFSGGSYSLTGEETITLSYVEIPILARVATVSGLYFNGGPYLGFLAGFKDEATATLTTTAAGQSPVTVTESQSTTDDSGWSSADFGLKVGLGFKFIGGLDFAANYTIGLSNLIDDSSNTAYSAHNSVIGITAGYWFGGK
jgi:hypothetical protein